MTREQERGGLLNRGAPKKVALGGWGNTKITFRRPPAKIKRFLSCVHTGAAPAESERRFPLEFLSK
jgi:hypothetical protein